MIGGGLTGIDTTTEAAAYYPVQVEKFLERWEALGHEAAATLELTYDHEEREIAREFLEHGRAVRAERERAVAAGEVPNFAPLVEKWGGVSLVYRRDMSDSPAYRLNHEEITKFFEEGVRFVEKLAPLACVPDERGALKAVEFERLDLVDGELKGTGEKVTLPARSLFVAAGTAPNTTYERERPGSFEIDHRAKAFKSFKALRGEDGALKLEEAGSSVGFFTSYLRDGHTVSYYGDNHPVYAGSVVRAMASAKDGAPHVEALFADEIAKLDAAAQPARDAAWKAFSARLDDEWRATVVRVDRLTPTIVEVIVRAPAAARHFEPGQFFRLQNYEALAKLAGTPHLTPPDGGAGAHRRLGRQGAGAPVADRSGDGRQLAPLHEPPAGRAGGRHGPHRHADGDAGRRIRRPGGRRPRQRRPVLDRPGAAGAGEPRPLLRRLPPARGHLQDRRDRGGRRPDHLERRRWRAAGPAPPPGSRLLEGNVVQAMGAYARGELGEILVPLPECHRVIAIGSDRMMKAVKDARHGVLAQHFRPGHVAIASINSPMQCMMKEICAQCLQRHIDPATGKETIVFSCSNQDQPQDFVDWKNLADRLRQNTVQEKLTDLWVRRLLTHPEA